MSNHRNHRTRKSWADRVLDPRYKGWVEAALADVRAHPADAHRARRLARLLWGDGGAVLLDAAKPPSERYTVGKRASVATGGLDSRGHPLAYDVAYGAVGRGPDFARAFADAADRGRLARVLLTALDMPRRPVELDERPKCWDPAAHKPTWIFPAGVAGAGPEPMCSACLSGGRVPGVF